MSREKTYPFIITVCNQYVLSKYPVADFRKNSFPHLGLSTTHFDVPQARVNAKKAYGWRLSEREGIRRDAPKWCCEN